MKNIERKGIKWDLVTLLLLIGLLNLPLLRGQVATGLIFYPKEVIGGKWWRVITHPFVHVSLPHFLLDAGAFWMLYASLAAKRTMIRIFHLIACGVGSLALAWSMSPVVADYGLCGLSGIAHGLMAIVTLEMAGAQKLKTAGAVAFGLVLGKCVLEMLSGAVLFSPLYHGALGIPVAACHSGGFAGGVGSFAILRYAFSCRSMPSSISPVYSSRRNRIYAASQGNGMKL